MVGGEARNATRAAARELLATAQEDLAQGLAELRELARGIHPIILTERGLGPALDALLARAAVPVEIAMLPEERLTRAGRGGRVLRGRGGDHQRRQVRGRVAARRSASAARTGPPRSIVSDDGVGGADPARGSGLRGLAARVEALNGHLDVDSPPGRGTRITAEIPLA